MKYLLKKEGYEKSSDKSYMVLYIRLYIYICGDYACIEKWFFIFYKKLFHKRILHIEELIVDLKKYYNLKLWNLLYETSRV